MEIELANIFRQINSQIIKYLNILPPKNNKGKTKIPFDNK